MIISDYLELLACLDSLVRTPKGKTESLGLHCLWLCYTQTQNSIVAQKHSSAQRHNIR